MNIPITMPQSGTQTEARLEEWLVAVGDTVSAGDLIGVIETDKAAVDIEAPAAGVVASLLAQPGDEVSIDNPLGFISQAGDD